MSKGYTIIELIIMITIIGILAISITVGMPGRSIDLAAQAAQVAQDMRYTQSLAMTRGQKFRICFSTNTYQITDNGGTLVPNPTTGTTNPQLASGMSFSTSLSGNCLALDSEGTPYQGTYTSPFTSNETVTLSLSSGGGGGCSGGGGGCVAGGGTGCVITITPNTGYISVACSS